MLNPICQTFINRNKTNDIISNGIMINLMKNTLRRLNYISNGNYVDYFCYLIASKNYDKTYVINFCKNITNGGTTFTKSLETLTRIKSIMEDFS